MYQSDTRTCSLEDCIHFFPGLFKLSKSIIVSEPLSTATIPGLDAVSQSLLDITQDMTFKGGNAEMMSKLQGLNESLVMGVRDEDNVNPRRMSILVSVSKNAHLSFTTDFEDALGRRHSNIKAQVSIKLKTLIKRREQLKAKRVTTMGTANVTFGEGQD